MLASALSFVSTAAAVPFDQAARPTHPTAAHDSAAPVTDAPDSEHDDTRWRFELQQEGEPGEAEDFDAWLERKDVHVATGKAGGTPAKHCLSAEDGGEDGGAGGDGGNHANCPDR